MEVLKTGEHGKHQPCTFDEAARVTAGFAVGFANGAGTGF